VAPTKKTLRVLIVAEIVFGFGSIIAYRLGATSFPETLRHEGPSPFAELTGPLYGITLILALLLLVVRIAATVGLWVLWRPSRLLYLIITVVTVLSGLPFDAFGPRVETGLSFTMIGISDIVAGIILGLIYFSPLKTHFEKTEARGSGAAAEV